MNEKEAQMTATAALSPHKTMLLTTFRKDGTPVGSPVTVAVVDGRIFFRTYTDTWKFKRMRRNPQVEVAPATFRGKPLGPGLPGRARRLDGDDVKLARKAIKRRSPVLQGMFVPALHRLMRYTTVHYELIPTDA
jgi:uncharacterized protein